MTPEEIKAVKEQAEKEGLVSQDTSEFKSAAFQKIKALEQKVAELEQSLKAAQDEVERLRSEAGYHDAKDVINQLGETVKHLESHNLQLVEACRDFLLVCSSMNTAKHRERIVDWDDEPILPQRKEWIEYFLEEKAIFEQSISSPASKKYMAMIEVVEIAKRLNLRLEGKNGLCANAQAVFELGLKLEALEGAEG